MLELLAELDRDRPWLRGNDVRQVAGGRRALEENAHRLTQPSGHIGSRVVKSATGVAGGHMPAGTSARR